MITVRVEPRKRHDYAADDFEPQSTVGIAVILVAFPLVYIGSVWLVCTGIIEFNGGVGAPVRPFHDERADEQFTSETDH